MVRVLTIRETPENKFGGIDAHCQALKELFCGDNEIEMLPILDFKRHTFRPLRTRWLDSKEIEDSIDKYDPDIVHVHGASTLTVAIATRIAKRKNKGIILSPHFHPFYGLKRPLLGKLFYNIILRPLLKDYEAIITINKEDTEWFKQYHNNVVMTPHWNRFDKIIDKPKKKRNSILFVGRVSDPMKRVNDLFEIPEGKYDIHIVGQGDMQVRSDMTLHKNVSDTELKRLYAEASLLVIPSQYEAFSYVALEALLCNTPVVLSERVRISDHLPIANYVGRFKFGDFDDFNRVIDKTINQEVDVNLVSHIFGKERIKAIYKNIYLKGVVNRSI